MGDQPPEGDRRGASPGRRAHDIAPDVVEDLAALATAAGARVSALEDIGEDLATLTSAVDALASSIERMATKEEVAEAEARLDRKRSLAVIAGAVGLLLLAIPAIATVVLLGRLDDVLDESVATGDYLVECTTPSPPDGLAISDDDAVHECYEDAQARQAEAVQALYLATLDAAVCARETPETSRIVECFAARVEARTGTRPSILEGES